MIDRLARGGTAPASFLYKADLTSPTVNMVSLLRKLIKHYEEGCDRVPPFLLLAIHIFLEISQQTQEELTNQLTLQYLTKNGDAIDQFLKDFAGFKKDTIQYQGSSFDPKKAHSGTQLAIATILNLKPEGWANKTKNQ